MHRARTGPALVRLLTDARGGSVDWFAVTDAVGEQAPDRCVLQVRSCVLRTLHDGHAGPLNERVGQPRHGEALEMVALRHHDGNVEAALRARITTLADHVGDDFGAGRVTATGTSCYTPHITDVHLHAAAARRRQGCAGPHPAMGSGYGIARSRRAVVSTGRTVCSGPTMEVDVTDHRRDIRLALPGRGLVARLRRLAAPAPPVPVPARRANPGAVVDCAVYADGRRLSGRPHYADAYVQARHRRGAFVWLGLHDPDAPVMAAVGRTFGLHELTVEQALADGHRPAVERQGELILLVLRTARYIEHDELTATSEVVDTGDVMVLVGSNFIVTVRHGAAGALAEVRDSLQQRHALLAEGPWSVAYAVCARMVELYLEVAAHVEHDLERLEETAFARDRHLDMQQIYQLKRELVEFKRAVVPLQAPLRALTEQPPAALPETLRRYFVDLNGRLALAVDRVAAFDELVNSIMQARLAQLAVDQNNDMRKIAAWAAIAAVQTAVAGVYGMNFEHMPELGSQYGYPAAVLLMAAAAVTLHRLFRRSGWL